MKRFSEEKKVEKLVELTKKYKTCYPYSDDKFELRDEERKYLCLVPVTALSAVLLAAKEMQFTGFIFFTEKIGGTQTLYLPIDFVKGKPSLGKHSWGWQRRVHARNFVRGIVPHKKVVS